MYKKFLKRVIDFILALIALPFVLIAIVILSPIIYINDHGPMFYNAKRRGYRGKTFTMFKFRSMYINSPDLRNTDGSTFNSTLDPRVTKVGRILRKFSLDEIPQLLNVLIGDMSLVGPRPTLAKTPYMDLDEVRKKKLEVRPGITGYAQAYFRNSITQDEKFKWDAYYVDHVSFILDCKIFAHTILAVLKHENVFVSTETTVAEPVKQDNAGSEMGVDIK